MLLTLFGFWTQNVSSLKPKWSVLFWCGIWPDQFLFKTWSMKTCCVHGCHVLIKFWTGMYLLSAVLLGILIYYFRSLQYVIHYYPKFWGECLAQRKPFSFKTCLLRIITRLAITPVIVPAFSMQRNSNSNLYYVSSPAVTILACFFFFSQSPQLRFVPATKLFFSSTYIMCRRMFPTLSDKNHENLLVFSASFNPSNL